MIDKKDLDFTELYFLMVKMTFQQKYQGFLFQDFLPLCINKEKQTNLILMILSQVTNKKFFVEI